jgi:hypothetical protein
MKSKAWCKSAARRAGPGAPLLLPERRVAEMRAAVVVRGPRAVLSCAWPVCVAMRLPVAAPVWRAGARLRLPAVAAGRRWHATGSEIDLTIDTLEKDHEMWESSPT